MDDSIDRKEYARDKAFVEAEDALVLPHVLCNVVHYDTRLNNTISYSKYLLLNQYALYIM